MDSIIRHRRIDITGSNQSGLTLDFRNEQPLLPETPVLQKSKRALDIALSILALAALSPLIVMIAVALKATSPGPLLFVQTREGLNGKSFQMYKFRTLHSAASDYSGLQAVQENDIRVCRVGAFLRRTSLDEIPQLFNVLAGEMSLVGPRPHVPGMRVGADRYDEVVPYYHLRNRVKPGLTGWAQANGLRGTIQTVHSAKARVDHDLAYLANVSVILDIKILIKTIWHEATELGRGT
jgi:lipopolysaccharide/colanic/teichoic acid biosynthesis glycosyltransferase